MLMMKSFLIEGLVFFHYNLEDNDKLGFQKTDSL